MTNARIQIKDWLPAIGALCLVVAAVGYAISRSAHVSDEIRNMDALAATLNAKANDVEKGVHTADDIAAMSARRGELEQRMIDSRKPALIASQLTEAARTTGLQVLEIQPLANSQMAGSTLPGYRVMLKGGYREIANYLDGCTAQRIPVRVIGLSINRFDEEGPAASGDELRADITVEAFQGMSEDQKVAS